MKFAITPRGVGQPVGARAIEDGWELVAGETFTVDNYSPEMVLAENGTSLRAPRVAEINEMAKIGPLRDHFIRKGISFAPPSPKTTAEKLSELGIDINDLKSELNGKAV